MGRPDTRYGYGPYESRASRVFDRTWSVGKVALPLAAIAFILARGGRGEDSMPQENYLFPENGIIASPVAATPEAQAGFVVPGLGIDGDPAGMYEE